MQQLIKNLRGVSPVIGALMLTLITITAAGSFAVFVSQKQEMIQDQQWAELQKSLEKLEVSNINLGTNFLNFTIFNSGTRNLKIDTIKINNGAWLNYTQVNQTEILRSDIHSFNVSNFSEIRLEEYNPQEDKPLSFEIFTTKGNSFETTFQPPSSIVKIVTESQWNSTNNSYEDFYILDGSLSDHPGDGYIVHWEWEITPQAATTFVKTGRKVRADPPISRIKLTVIDNNGMKGTDQLDL